MRGVFPETPISAFSTPQRELGVWGVGMSLKHNCSLCGTKEVGANLPRSTRDRGVPAAAKEGGFSQGTRGRERERERRGKKRREGRGKKRGEMERKLGGKKVAGGEKCLLRGRARYFYVRELGTLMAGKVHW